MAYQLYCSTCKKKYGKDDFSAKERQKTVDLVCLRHSTSSSYGQDAITHNPIRTYNGQTQLHFTTRCHLCKITLPKENGVFLIQYTDPTNPNASSNFFYCQNCYLLSNEQISDTDSDSGNEKQTNETKQSPPSTESSCNDFISDHDDIFDTTEDEEEEEEEVDKKNQLKKNNKRKSYVLHESEDDEQNENGEITQFKNELQVPLPKTPSKSKKDKEILHQFKKIKKLQNKIMYNLQKIQTIEMDILFKLNTHPN